MQAGKSDPRMKRVCYILQTYNSDRIATCPKDSPLINSPKPSHQCLPTKNRTQFDPFLDFFS